MGLSKPVITTEADISGITSTLAEIKGAVQENSGATDAPVIGHQSAYLDGKDISETKLISVTGRGFCSLNIQSQRDFNFSIKVIVDGSVVINKPSGTSMSANVGGVLPLTAYATYNVYHLDNISFSESLEIYCGVTTEVSTGAKIRANVLFQ